MSLRILDAFPSAALNGLPPFTSDGVLPPGDFAPGLSDFEERFVETGDRERRQFLYEGLNRYRRALLDTGIPETAWMLINGSFTTSKSSPGDIDIAVEVPIAKIEDMRDHPADELFDRDSVKLRFQCDAYAIYTLPFHDPNYENFTQAYVRVWTQLFGMTRYKTTKGRVWIKAGGLK